MSKDKKWSSYPEQQRLTENFRKWAEEETVEVDEGVFDTVKAGGKKLFAKLTGKYNGATHRVQRIKQEVELAHKAQGVTSYVRDAYPPSKFDWKAFGQWRHKDRLRTVAPELKRAATTFLEALKEESADDFLRTSKRGLELIKYLEVVAKKAPSDPFVYGEIADAILSVLEESKGWAAKEDDVPAVYYNVEALQDLANDLVGAAGPSIGDPAMVIKHGNYLLQAIKKARYPEEDSDVELRAEQFFLALVGGENDNLGQFFKGDDHWSQ